MLEAGVAALEAEIERAMAADLARPDPGESGPSLGQQERAALGALMAAYNRLEQTAGQPELRSLLLALKEHAPLIAALSQPA